ncbi:MAG: HPF/RaiA family ribosome-associated protein [Pirellulales bacterium]|nr:HPF/RaiA family ribosome-associated protein [Pirellulales bacterium]
MRFSVYGDRVNIGSRLREYIDHHLYFSLGRFAPAIDRVDVRLEDTNGPRGGIDKRCRIVVKLRTAGSSSIVINDDDENLHAVISRTIARAGRTVARTLDRKHGKHAYQRRREITDDVLAVEKDI